MGRGAVLVIGMLAGAAGGARAQACFHPRPAPTCGTFWLVEASTERRDGRLPGRDLAGWELLGSFALGGMTNLSERWAVGGALVAVTRGAQEPGEGTALERLGLVARGRRWLGREVSVDLSAGLWRLRGAGPTVELAIGFGGLVGVAVGARGDGPWPRRGEVYLGVRYSSYAAVVAGVLGLGKALASIGD